VTSGTACLSSSSRFPINAGSWKLNPVVFPPGRRQAGDEPLAHRVESGRKDMGIVPVGVLLPPGPPRRLGQDDIHLDEADELGPPAREVAQPPVRKAGLQGDYSGPPIAEGTEPLAEGLEAGV